MINLTRMDMSTIFLARTRMLDIKNNFKNKYKNNMKCRACNETIETQTHVLEECKAIHPNPLTKIRPEHYFGENTETLKSAASNIRRCLEVLEDEEKLTVRPKGTLQPGDVHLETL